MAGRLAAVALSRSRLDLLASHDSRCRRHRWRDFRAVRHEAAARSVQLALGLVGAAFSRRT
jgi:hypothetical protein